MNRIRAAGPLVALAAWLLPACGPGAESVRDFDLQPIRSLNEIDGDWEIAPDGVGLFEGDSMRFAGGKCRYSQYTCGRPTALKQPIEFDVTLQDGALLLNTENPQVIAKKWHLAKLGEYKCLICVTTNEQHPMHASTSVFYHRQSAKKNPAELLPQAEPKPFQKRMPARERRRGAGSLF